MRPLLALARLSAPRGGGGWQTPGYCSACHRNHPGPCGCPCHQPAAMNPVALYDALNLMSSAVLLAEGGDARGAETMLLEASLSVTDAFPAGTPEALALGVVLAAAGRVTEMTP